MQSAKLTVTIKTRNLEQTWPDAQFNEDDTVGGLLDRALSELKVKLERGTIARIVSEEKDALGRTKRSVLSNEKTLKDAGVKNKATLVLEIEGPSHPWAASLGTLIFFIIFIVVGSIFTYYPNPLIAAISFGIVGGIAHEIAQSGGRVIVPTPEPNGIQLGTLVGAALGVVAGILSLHGVIIVNTPSQTLTPNDLINVVVTALSAGVALKALADIDPSRKEPKQG
jgi:hypothetical protein